MENIYLFVLLGLLLFVFVTRKNEQNLKFRILTIVVYLIMLIIKMFGFWLELSLKIQPESETNIVNLLLGVILGVVLIILASKLNRTGKGGDVIIASILAAHVMFGIISNIVADLISGVPQISFTVILSVLGLWASGYIALPKRPEKETEVNNA